MKSIKKLLVALLAVSTLGTFALASSCANKGEMSCKSSMQKSCMTGDKKNCEMKNRMSCDSKASKSCNMKNGKSCHGKKAHKKDATKFIVGAIMALDLSQDQEKKIQNITTEYKQQRKMILDAFTKEGFIKSNYIEARMNKKQNKIHAQADMIEKMYAVLNSNQKVELLKEIEDFYAVRSQKCKSGKACHR